MKILPPSKINAIKPSTKRDYYSLQERSGVYVLVEKIPNNCKRIVGVTQYPRGRKGKNVEIPLGVWGREISTKDDLHGIIRKWMELKFWCKETGYHPKYYGSEPPKSEKTLGEVVDSFLEDYHKLKVKEVTWKTSKGRLVQILDFFGEDRLLSDFELRNGGRERIVQMHDHIKKGTRYGKLAINHAGKCRHLIKQVFNFAIDRGWMDEFQNPAERKLLDEGLGHIKGEHPYLSYKELPELLNSIEENSSNAYVLTRLLTKFYLLSCIRVGAIVSLEWDWFDSENDVWVLPPETTGLKRKKGKGEPHLIPATPEMHSIMNQLREINGNKKYVFASKEGRKYPHPDKGCINDHLIRLGFGGRQNAHGWRDVVVTVGQEEGKFKRDIIQRQIGHTEHKRGAIGSYDNSEFLKERREFLEWWNKELVSLGMKITEKEFVVIE